MNTIKVADYVHGGTQKDFYSEIEVENCNCPLCNSNDFNFLFRERGNIGIVECRNCNLIYVNPRIKSLEKIYWGDPEKYFEEARFIFLDKKPHHRDRNYIEELKQIKKHKFPGKLLDIGCNMGFFLRKAKEMGYDSYGIDPSPSLTQLGRKYFDLNIENNFLEKSSFQGKSFDVITIIDVFEHITGPKEFLKQVHGLLKDDGLVCIKVPNGNYNKMKLSIAKVLQKDEGADIFDSYEHIVHYSILTMRKMIKACKFKVKELFQPLPIQSPVWHLYVGQYFQYPSPFCLDWKRNIARNIFYQIGKIEGVLKLPVYFSPDLMFLIEKE